MMKFTLDDVEFHMLLELRHTFGYDLLDDVVAEARLVSWAKRMFWRQAFRDADLQACAGRVIKHAKDVLQ